jgi:group I intron endonuclease
MDGTGVIYRHTYIWDGRSYIGQSIHGEEVRTKGHLRSKDSTYFHRAIRKYGWDNFTTEILHENIDPVYLDDWEMYYIALYETLGTKGFNMTAGGRGIRGYRHTETHKNQLSVRMAGANNPFFGRKHSEETLQRITATRMGEKNPNFGKPHSEEHKKKIAESHLKSVEQWSSDGKTYIHTFDSITLAGNVIGKSPTGISQCLRGSQKTSGGFTWKYSAPTEEEVLACSLANPEGCLMCSG